MSNLIWEIDDNDEAVTFAYEIIKNNYPLLVNTKFTFFRSEKGNFRTKTKIASGELRASTDESDIIITINDEEWHGLDHTQKQAQIHWALAHISCEENEKDGTIKYKLRKPVIQDFPEVVAKWGAC
jgi:hypothetical protein